MADVEIVNEAGKEVRHVFCYAVLPFYGLIVLSATNIVITLQLKIELIGPSQSKFDESNPLVLPSKKRNTVVKKQDVRSVRLLSKKQRKVYEKILEKKKKKAEVFILQD